MSYGERRPAAPNDSPENMQLNRRDEFRVVLKEGEKMPVIVETATETIIAGARADPCSGHYPAKARCAWPTARRLKPKWTRTATR
ncbi:MAG: hypothetical protein WKG07_47505 [Hymenobacter sp.]